MNNFSLNNIIRDLIRVAFSDTIQRTKKNEQNKQTQKKFAPCGATPGK